MFVGTRIKGTLTIVCVFVLLQLVTVDKAFSQETENHESFHRVFYVATNGNDRWSGTLPTPNSSGDDGPFATLLRARDFIRELKTSGHENDTFTVLVRSGTYNLKETFVLGPEDSGTASRPLVFKAFGDEHPVLSGAGSINNFKPYKDKIYKAALKGTGLESHNIRQLFANGQRQVLSRFPHADPLDPIGGGFLYVDTPAKKGGKRAFKYQAGSVHEWANLRGAEVVIFPGPNYSNNIVSVAGIDRNTRVVTLSEDTSYEIESGNRYFFQNLLEELDSPGEWYFDRRGKAIYYWPASCMSSVNVTIPVLGSILQVRGRKHGNRHYGTPSHIRFEGFTLENCEGSAIVVNGAKNTVIAGCTIHNAGDHGIEIQDGFENLAVGNDICDVGGVGISISGGDRRALTPANNRAENNYIHHVGTFLKTSSGIYCKGVGNVISHNLIHSTPRAGIWFDGNDHLIEYNRIYRVNQETQDSGMVYCSQIDWTKRGNVVRFNYLHDSGGFGWDSAVKAWHTPFYTHGIYLDDWTSGTEVYGNIIANAATSGILIHGGRDNIIENNVIIEGGRLGQMLYSGWPAAHPTAQELLPKMYANTKEMGYTKYPLLSTIKDIQTGARMSGNSFVRNIVYYQNLDAPLYDIYHDIDLATTVSDFNVIYHMGLPLLVPYTKAVADLQWREWKNKGQDKNSIVGDPLFDPSKAGTYQLLPASPALRMGFQPIPFDKIGPYADPMRASWPIPE